jgi:hypothetical protein
VNPYDNYWQAEMKQSRARVRAACHAVGAAGYLLSGDCDYSNPERLTRLAEIIAELREALGLPKYVERSSTPEPQDTEAGEQP